MLTKFKNKKVIITGHTGFKGSWLSTWLTYLGASVVGVSNEIVTTPSNFKINKIRNKINHNFMDIRDVNKLTKLIIKNKPDYIFHLAAQSLVKKSYINSKFTFETNAFGTLNLLEALRAYNPKKKCSVVLVTSDKSYRNLELKRGYRENDILGGYDPYSASKACAELIIQCYLKSFLNNNKYLKISVARAGNVIGGGDWSKDRIIPDIIRSISSKKKLVIRNPSSTRPWQHVLDPLMGYIILGMKTFRNNDYSGAWNFGPSNDKVFTVKDVVNQISKNLKINKNKFLLKNNKTANFKEARLLKLNCDKANEYLNWKPKLTSTESINLTSDWYKSYFYKKDMFTETQNQIKSYLKKYE